MAEGTAAGISWRDVYGRNYWDGLLDPLHPDLRSQILTCGDFNQATYDSFNNDANSPYCGSCRFGKNNFFQKVSMVKPGEESPYEVFGYLYATAQSDLPQTFVHISLSREAWSKESNWIGYVAVSTDAHSATLGRRDVVIAWRGTTRNLEWVDVADPLQKSINDLLHPKHRSQNSSTPKKSVVNGDKCKFNFLEKLLKKDGEDNVPEAKVMRGWHTIYTSQDPKSPFSKVSARTQLFTMIKMLVEKYREEDLEMSITLVGHSLGASLSVLSGFDLVENGLTQVGPTKEPIPVTAFVFGCPEIGNKEFNDMFKKLPNLRVLHIRNEIDIIPHYPGKALGYEKTGVELVVDTRKSDVLKDSRNPSDWHNLQAVVHVVAGWHGKDGEFRLEVDRSVALVNKSCEYLKEECLVPGSWWVEKNKGMVQGEDGKWFIARPCEEDKPVPEEFDWWVFNVDLVIS